MNPVRNPRPRWTFARPCTIAAPMLNALADGSWLTRERVRTFAIFSIVFSVLTLTYLVATSSGTLDRYGRPLGTDFSGVWTAGRMALDGHAAQSWDWSAHYRAQRALHGQAVPFFGWHYPPPFLLVATLLATMPYLVALAAWQATTLGAAAALVRRIIPGGTAMLAALGAPVVFVCLAHGHNGFLTGALLGGGLYLLDRRPFLAGLLLGCLIYKPHFGLLVPPLLLFGRHWRALLGASLSGALLAGLTLAIWGWPVWQAFIDSLPVTRNVVIESGATGWEKIQSPFAMVRMWGGGIEIAYFVQAIATMAAIAMIAWLAIRGQPATRNAAILAAALISTPYVLDYDFVLLGIAIAFLVADGLKRGFLPWEKSLLALAWLSPFFARQLGALALIPLGQATAIIVLVLAARRAVMMDGAGPMPGPSSSRKSAVASVP
jgi:hypothetical protein